MQGSTVTNGYQQRATAAHLTEAPRPVRWRSFSEATQRSSLGIRAADHDPSTWPGEFEWRILYQWY